MIKSADSPKKLLASKKSHRFLEFLIHTKLFFFLKLNSSSKQNYVFFPVFAWLEVSNLSEFPQSNSQHRTYIRTYTPTHLHTLPTDLHPYINTYIHTYIHTSVHPCIRTFRHPYILSLSMIAPLDTHIVSPYHGNNQPAGLETRQLNARNKGC